MKKIRKKINLQKEYDRLNKLLFEDRLPGSGSIHLKWSKAKKYYGHAKIKRRNWKLFINNRGEKYWIATYRIIILMSYARLPTYNRFLATLAHEMLHVYFWMIEQDWKQSHGSKFQQKARKLSLILSSAFGTKIIIRNGTPPNEHLFRQLKWCQDHNQLYYK